MSKADRLYVLKALFDSGQGLSRARLLRELGVSYATLKRDLAFLRDRMGAPIVFDRDLDGWRLDRTAGTGGAQYEFPGMWMRADEIHALLTLHHLITQLDAGAVLRGHLRPLRRTLERWLFGSGTAVDRLRDRMVLQSPGSRRIDPSHFRAIATALGHRRRIHIQYRGRERDVTTVRTLSPQRLVYVNGNWYLDAWCHERDGLRRFSVDAIAAVDSVDEAAIDVEPAELVARFDGGYGVFVGEPVEWATLHFSSNRTRWVADERWHPAQRRRLEPDGTLVLEVPYSDPREITMDVLRYMPDVTVLGPRSLREDIQRRLAQALSAMSRPPGPP